LVTMSLMIRPLQIRWCTKLLRIRREFVINSYNGFLIYQLIRIWFL
jgi:hypothetical protein